MSPRRIGVAGGVLLAVAAAAIAFPGLAGQKRGDARDLFSPEELAAIYRHSPSSGLPADPTDRVADNPDAARLGQYLFFDAALSGDGTVSCATCHQPAHGFTDARPLAKGLAIGVRHTPTVLNAAFSPWFFWDGRADSLWSQALGPLENPREAGGDRLHIAHVVADDPALREAYEGIFGPLPQLSDASRFPDRARPDADVRSPLDRAWRTMAPADQAAVNRVFSNLGKVFEAYERRLAGGRAPFDAYVEGLRTGDPVREAAISDAAKRGLKVFAGEGQCELCHAGASFSDGQFHNLGMPVAPGADPDLGRSDGVRLVRADPFNGAGAYSDDPAAARDKLEFLPDAASQAGAFKTPGLRDVALTAPYGHDGRFADLAQVMTFYAQGREASRGRVVGQREATADLVPPLTAMQQADLVAFLATLTAAPPAALTRAPARP